MRVFVTGATGVLGRSLVPMLVEDGHEVRAVARRGEAAVELRERGAEPVVVDLFDPDAVRGAVGGAEAVLHMATNVPPMRRASRRGAWATNDRLRTEATRNLVGAARATGVARVVMESVTFVYPDRGEAWIDEEVPPAGYPLLAPTLEGERIARGFGESGGGEAVVLRFGLFYGGRGNRATLDVLRLARFGAAPIAGAPKAFMSSIHVDDAASAVLASLGAPGGLYNVVDDEPLPRRAVLDAIAAAMGTKRLHATPRWLIRLAAGRSAGALTASQRVSNRRLREATGWVPCHPSVVEGWQAVAAELEAARVEGGSDHGP